ncbi:MAG: AI-2E family transporter [Clostridiales bacterium]|jgi:predicted PurR-regulated permease PerM|nr:AI-2E family transporter [Clostridiales bacterium]
MKFPWNRNYLIIGFHAALAFAAMYLLKILLDGAAYIFTSLPDFFDGVGGFFKWLLSLFTPLIIAVVISYLLDPLVDFFQSVYDKVKSKVHFNFKFLKKRKRKREEGMIKDAKFKSRTAGTAIVYLLIFSALGLLVSWIVRKFNVENNILSFLIQSVQSSRSQFTASYRGFEERLMDLDLLSFITDYLTKAIDSVGLMLQNLATGVLTSLTSAGGSILNFFLGLILAFYIMSGKEKIFHGINDLLTVFLPAGIRSKIIRVTGDVHHVLIGYIRGTLTDVLIVSIMISGYLYIIDVDFALIIGVFTGLANIIPYFGAFLGLILSVVVAFLSGDPLKALYAGIGVFILQQIDGMVINPRVVGKNVELSPIAVIVALSAAGSLFGVLGMILAAPVCAILKLFFTRYVEYRKLEKNI